MNGFRMVTGIALLANASALAESYVWDGADGSSTLGPVTVEKASGVASLTGPNSSWAYADESSYASLVGVDLLSATTLSSLTVADGVDFKAAVGALDQGDGALPGAVSVSRSRVTFVASPDRPIVSAATISGAAGVVAFTGDGSGGIEMEPDAYSTPNNQTIKSSDSGEWEVIEGTRLADLVSVTGCFYSGDPRPAGSFFFENNGATASVQLQMKLDLVTKGDQAGIIGAIIDFKQQGADLLFRLRHRAGYYKRASNPGYEEPGSFKFLITETGGQVYPISSAGASWASWWNVVNLNLSFKSKVGSYSIAPEVTISTAAQMTSSSGARFVFGDAEGNPIKVTVNHKSAFAGASMVEICPNATVYLEQEGNNSSGYGLSEGGYVLDPAATLVSQRAFSVGSWQGVELGAGALWEQKNSSGTYLSSLTYHNGAKTIGNVNLGQGYHPTIKVDGQGDSSVHEGAIRVYTYTSLTTTFDIASQGTPWADYIVTGGIAELVAGSNNDMKFKKAGDGKLRVDGPITATRHPFQLHAGTLELGANGVSGPALNLVSKGDSTLACVECTTNAIGNLTLEANLTLEVKYSGSLSIGSISEWADEYPEVRLEIIAEDDASIRIGTSAADLPESVRLRMRLNGEKCQVNADGYVEYQPRVGMLLRFK